MDESHRETNEDLKKVELEAMKKSARHRLDEYLALVLGIGAVLILWFLQEIGVY